MFRKLCLLFLFSHSFLLGKEIVFWHAFEGFLKDIFQEVVEDFNHQSGAYQIRLVQKGNYTEVFNRGVEAFERGDPPHILQVFEVATETMMMKPEIFYSVEELMRRFFKKFDSAVYIDTVREFYSTPDHKMYSLPWNASTGIMFYNKDAFKKAGLDPNKPPSTWPEMEQAGLKLVNAGYKGFVTAWPAAYHLEYTTAIHNLPFATLDNGFKGPGARLIFNGPTTERHLDNLVSWERMGIFQYLGRFTMEPEKFFAEGKCGIIMQGANRYSILKKMTAAPIGVGFIPYYPDVTKSPFALPIGGSSFWAMAGFDEEIYRGIAQFFNYLSSPEVQAYWHQKTGYLPITEAAYYLSKKKGFYEENPAAEIAVLEVMQRPSTPYTRGIRLGGYTVVREKIIDYLEKAFKGEISPKEALDRAISDGNSLLSDFEKQNQK